MRWLPILQSATIALLLAGRSFGQPASVPSDEVERMPAFKVSEPRAGDFLIQWGPYEKKPIGTIIELTGSGPTRMWLLQWPRKNLRSDPPPVKTALYLGAAFRGRGLKSGDEIVSISGKLLTEMKPYEPLKRFLAAVGDPDKMSVEVEVQSKGEKGVRKVIVTKAPFNEVIVTKKPVELLSPIIPLPEPTVPASEPRDKK